ncbi:cyclic GMP-AMP synthase isoform X2 [Octodon degus]|uniref:Cyclic GMP-AMP synthase isoform X2 n=1 Tax=Octodon degus TaxID=10160 RepID=A0A6P6DY63_OCTDE|nr:cyclic GMP-AMP synthase isoform X2 [Octodon degus]
MASRRRKTERTAPEARGASLGGPELVPKAAPVQPGEFRFAGAPTPARPGLRGPPAGSTPARRRPARSLREKEEKGEKEEKEHPRGPREEEDPRQEEEHLRDPREEEDDRQEERAAPKPAARRSRACSRATLVRSLELGASLGESEATPDDRQLRAVLDRLRLKFEELSWASKEVKKLVKRLQQALKDSEFHGATSLNSGSYYEHVKISEPDEFDVMFTLNIPRIELQEYAASGAYYSVKFKRNPKENPLDKFVEEGFLSAAKVLSRFREIIKAEINSSTPAEDLRFGPSKQIQQLSCKRRDPGALP